ncbi:collagenase [Evansella clarkii]|uniref:collagenase n=1 Tax=Evansella clarkii TaxID=79879 RepID=UPI00142FA019|nr:collagenase [Evansella clarkii]
MEVKRMIIIFFTGILLAVTVGIFSLNTVMETETEEDLGVFEAVQSAVSANYDSPREKQLKSEWNKMNYKHLTFYYPDEAEELVPITKETVEIAMEKTKTILGEYNKRPADVFIFENQEDLEQFAGETGIDGYYSDIKKLIGLAPEDKQALLGKSEEALFEFQSTLVHEYTHYAAKQKMFDLAIDPERIPVWFEEGISEYAGKDKFVEQDAEAVSFSTLTEKRSWEEADKKEDTDVYGQSFLAVNYLIEEHGEEIINDILIETKKTGGFYKGLYQTTRLTLHDLDQSLSEEET